MKTHYNQPDLLNQPVVDKISMQEDGLIKGLESTKEKISAFQVSLRDTVEMESDWCTQNDWSAPVRILLESNADYNPDMFLNLLSQISREEYFFLEAALLEMITHVHQLGKEMQDLCNINAPKIKNLKQELKLLKKSLFKMMNSSNGISIEEVKTSDRILAIEYELNNLQYHREYSVLSATKARARLLPADRLKDSELSNLIKLDIIKDVRFPLNLENVVIIANKNDLSEYDSMAVSEKIQYGFSELGLKFIEACTGKLL